jgi:predicted N-formylglutamate amidohydrolase
LSKPEPRHHPAGFSAPLPEVRKPNGRSPVVLVCEHASNFFPPELRGLGLEPAVRESHIAWDPGALPVAEAMARRLDATLVNARVSRLVYDCNRPPHAPDAMPARSEIFDVPGNASLDEAERALRTELVYQPFREALAEVLSARDGRQTVMVTIHTFTPVYKGVTRDVELGILCDEDARLADAMLQVAARHTSLDVRRNEPYGPADGVTHTLIEHGLSNGILNVMIEIRNDLVRTGEQQAGMAHMLCDVLEEALAGLGVQMMAEGAGS